LTPQTLFSLKSNLSAFSHDKKLDATRLFMQPRITHRLLDESWAFVKPSVSLHATHYDFDRDIDSQVSRVIPTFSVDSGLFFDRSLKAGQYTQTLEPRLFYTYVPAKDQSNIPNFDTAKNTISWPQLFNENTYSGQDKVDAKNQMTLSLGSRIIDNDTGDNLLAVRLGQNYLLDKTALDLNGYLFEKESKLGELMLDVSAKLARDIYLDTNYVYSSETASTDTYAAGVRYTPDVGKTLSARVVYDQAYNFGYDGLIGPSRQLDIAGQWPLQDNLYGIFRYNRSLIDDIAIEHLLGLEYNAGCWSLRLSTSRYLTGVDEYRFKYFLQFELKDLTSVGTSKNAALGLNIPGYSPTSYIDQSPATME
jgi:LPS-assembly protein